MARLRDDMIEMANLLAMFACQLRDTARDTANDPPNMWLIESACDEYRDIYKRWGRNWERRQTRLKRKERE